MSDTQKVYHKFLRYFYSFKKEDWCVNGQSGLERESFLANFKCSPLQFAYAINYRTNKVFYCQNFEQVLGYKNAAIDLQMLFDILHPDDAPIVVDFLKISYEFALQFKFLKPFADVAYIDYRVKKKDGSYIRVNRQSTALESDNEGNVVSALSICTNITNLKKSLSVDYGVSGIYSDEFDKRYKTKKKTTILTKRELEVLNEIIRGKTSAEIALSLFLNVSSVKTYRKRILEKTDCKNSSELIYYAIKKGIIDID